MKCLVRFHRCVWLLFQFPGRGKKREERTGVESKQQDSAVCVCVCVC
jgi:hypothetical protein